MWFLFLRCVKICTKVRKVFTLFENRSLHSSLELNLFHTSLLPPKWMCQTEVTSDQT